MRISQLWLDLLLCIVAALIILTFLQIQRARIRSPAEHCGLAAADFSPPLSNRPTRTLSTEDNPNLTTTVSLELWVFAMRQYCWRAFLPWLAAQQIKQSSIALTVHPLEMNDPPFYATFTDAAQRGQAPDISFVRNADTLLAWVQAGYLTPMDECQANHPATASQFANVRPEIWQDARWQGKAWGVPLETNVLTLFFNRAKLQQLGWSQTEIASLPTRIRTGDFTLADLVATGRQAVQQGVVKPGNAFWPIHTLLLLESLNAAQGWRGHDPASGHFSLSPSVLAQSFRLYHQLINEQLMDAAFVDFTAEQFTDRLLWRDAVMHDHLLFWLTASSEWQTWAYNFVSDRGGSDYLTEQIGFAPFPSALAGSPGHVFWMETGMYVIASPSASGRQQQATVCLLLAQTLAPPLHLRHAYLSGFFHVLAEPIAHNSLAARTPRYAYPYAQAYQQQLSTLVLSEIRRAPPPSDVLTDHSIYQATMLTYLVKVSRAELTPEIAAGLAIAELRQKLGDPLVIE